MKNIFISVCFFSIAFLLNAQQTDKQHNTPGSELFADAPYRVPFTVNGDSAGIPVHVYVHGSNGNIYNNELSYVDIRLKNAQDNVFMPVLKFDAYSDSAFMGLFSAYSVSDPGFGIQDFLSSLPKQSNVHTIVFTSDLNIWVPPVPFVDIKLPYFYFTFTLPYEKLSALGSVIDIEVRFGLDWAEDEYAYLRVSRVTETFPRISGWYRGDVHYHGMFTQNDAENGMPLEGVKQAAALTGLDWITITDHSCDFDNYGTSPADNWLRLGQKIQLMNAQDSNFLLIRGMEHSVKNGQGKTVHALVYPPDSAPFSLPYIADAKGDLTPTDITVDMMLDSLKKYDGFCYAAHPFAELDALPFAVNGGVWNLADSLLPPNGSPHPTVGSVVANEMNVPSDIYDGSDSIILKDNLSGAQIFNYWNALVCDNSPYNPWNVFNETGSGFWINPPSEPVHYLYRLQQNFDVVKAVLQRGLIAKNNNSAVRNWKWYFSGGSDAHGDFNYSNTSFLSLAGISYNYVNDNAPGKINTLVYAPQGMGTDGASVLKALRKGHTVMSSGPVVTLQLVSGMNTQAICGDDFVVDNPDNYFLKLEMATNAQYGSFDEVQLVLGTIQGEIPFSLPSKSTVLYIPLNKIPEMTGYNPAVGEWYYIRASLKTHREFTADETSVYKVNDADYFAFTNPLWISQAQLSSTAVLSDAAINIFPVPADAFINVQCNYFFPDMKFSVTSVAGLNVKEGVVYGENPFTINISDLAPGIYVLSVSTDSFTLHRRFIKK